MAPMSGEQPCIWESTMLTNCLINSLRCRLNFYSRHSNSKSKNSLDISSSPSWWKRSSWMIWNFSRMTGTCLRWCITIFCCPGPCSYHLANGAVISWEISYPTRGCLQGLGSRLCTIRFLASPWHCHVSTPFHSFGYLRQTNRYHYAWRDLCDLYQTGDHSRLPSHNGGESGSHGKHPTFLEPMRRLSMPSPSHYSGAPYFRAICFFRNCCTN